MGKSIRVAKCLLLLAGFVLAMNVEATAHPYGGGGWNTASIGFRAGFSGGPNGLTYRKAFAPGQAFEAVVGYNGKVGRTLDLPLNRRGNSFAGISYAPFFEMGDRNLSVSLLGDFGARIRYHHYRPFGFGNNGWKMTPDLTAGAGMQVELNGFVQVFADLHLIYFNRYDNLYVPGMESGLGIRLVL